MKQPKPTYSLPDFHRALVEVSDSLAREFGGSPADYIVSPQQLRWLANKGRLPVARVGGRAGAPFFIASKDLTKAIKAIAGRTRPGAPIGNRNSPGRKPGTVIKQQQEDSLCSDNSTPAI